MGSVILKNRLDFYFAGRDVYLIPSFIFPPKEISLAYDFIEPTRIDFNSILNVEDFIEIEKEFKMRWKNI